MLKKKIVTLAKSRGIDDAPMLSRESGIPRQTCYDLWNSSHYPSAKTLAKLQKFFNCSLDELMEEQ